ncbi:MAG: hypothetical protein GX149_03335 [Acholeplasmataceae bacterium]|jgi:competence transcription factor ComK|nr:hypothetical protein [Acholeplasmataceae bacterium]
MLYLYHQNNLSKIVYKTHVQLARKPNLSIVKSLCEKELFSYESRLKLTKERLNIKIKIPIYINPKTLLFPIKSPKRYDNYWLNYFEIFSYEAFFEKTIILFYSLDEVIVNLSFKSFKKLYDKAKKLANYFQTLNP